jgi:hypothetical protein
MIHQEPPDQIVLISQPILVHGARRQKQAGVLDRASRQYASLRANADTLASGAGDLDALERLPRLIRQDLHNGGVQQHLYIFGLLPPEFLPHTQQIELIDPRTRKLPEEGPQYFRVGPNFGRAARNLPPV